MEGLKIIDIVKGSKADVAGLKSGDVILVFNDMIINSLKDYIKAKKIKPNRETILVRRNGKKLYFEWNRR